MKVWHQCNELGLRDADDDVALFVFEFQHTAVKLGGALNGIAEGRDPFDPACGLDERTHVLGGESWTTPVVSAQRLFARNKRGALVRAARLLRPHPPPHRLASPRRSAIPSHHPGHSETAGLRGGNLASAAQRRYDPPMPLYEFHCEKCQKESEILVRSSNWKGAKCPHCGSTRLAKKLSVFASSGGDSQTEVSCSGNPGSCGMCGTGRPHSH